MTAPLHAWLAEPMDADVARSVDRIRSAGDVVGVAAMPDVHLASDVCVGLVVATTHRIYPAAVGGDIGCGVSAVRLDCDADVLATERAAARLLTALQRDVPVLVHPRSAMDRPLPPPLEETPLSAPSLDARRRRDGRIEFATVGRGNHFVEFQEEVSPEPGRLWIAVHSGSRAMGGAIRDHHLRSATADDASGLLSIDADSAAGRAYLADHDWAIAYADANRRALLDAAVAASARALGVAAAADPPIHASHNHVRAERHGGATLLIHRKGAIPAGDGVAGIIPGSMGTATFHTSGRGAAAAFASSSHGAGRAMSRTEARRRISLRDLARDTSRGPAPVWFDGRLATRLVEEAPGAYRDIERVMRAQQDLTRIVRRLRPVLVHKGG